MSNTYLKIYVLAFTISSLGYSSTINAGAIWKSSAIISPEPSSGVTSDIKSKLTTSQKTINETLVQDKQNAILSRIPNESAAFRLAMIKKDRQISRLVLANEELKGKVIALNRQVIRYSNILKKTSRIALRKSEGSQSTLALNKEVSLLKTKLKRIRINDNIRCWKLKNSAQKNKLAVDIDCQAL